MMTVSPYQTPCGPNDDSGRKMVRLANRRRLAFPLGFAHAVFVICPHLDNSALVGGTDLAKPKTFPP